MRSRGTRLRYVTALVLLALGVAGLLSYPLTPHPDPTFVTVRFDGSAAAPGTIEVARPGPHAIWATAASGPDGDRCRVTAPGGGAVAVGQPRTLARWTSRAEDDAVYTRIATFDAPRAGSYGIVCAADPAAPGASYSVSERPDLRLAVSLVAAGAVAVVAAVAVGVVAFVRTRRAVGRRPQPDGVTG